LAGQRAAAGRSAVIALTRTGHEVLLAAVLGLLTVARAVAARPAVLAASTILLACVPVGARDVSASAHVTPADIGSVALVVAVVPRVFAGHRLPRSGLWVAVAAAVFAFGLATLTSQDPAASASGFIRYLQLFVVVPVAVVLALRDRGDLLLVCGALLAAAVIEALAGTGQYLTGTGASFAGHNVRAVGTFDALDIMGMSTVIGYGIVVALGLALVLRGRTRLALLALGTVLVVPLLFSLSRGGVIATGGAVLVMLLVASPRLAARTAVFAGAATVVAVGTLGTATGPLGARFATIGSSLTQPDQSVRDRYGLWQAAMGMWRDHPLTGVGLKQFAAQRDSYAPLNVSSGSDAAGAGLTFRREPLLSPHDMYLLVLSEQGLVGALAVGGLLLGLAVATWRHTRHVAGVGQPQDARLARGRLISVAAVGIVAWTLLSFVDADIGGQSTVLMSVLIGLAMWWAVQPYPGQYREAIR
jgi:O-antigen ligase